MLARLNTKVIAGVIVVVALGGALTLYSFGHRAVAAAEDDHGHDHGDAAAPHEDAQEDAPPQHDAHADEEVVLYELKDVAEGAIDTAEIREGKLDETVQATGQLAPYTDRIATASALIPGRISELRAQVGDYVEAGETLAIVESAEASRAHAAREEAKSRLALAEEELENTKAMAEAGVYAGKPVDEIRRERAEVASDLAAMRVEHQAEREDARASVAVVEAALARARAARDLAAGDLERLASLAEAGSIQHPPLEAARRDAATAQAGTATAEAGRTAATSELQRVAGLVELGTASQRELEAAQRAGAEADAAAARAEAVLEIADQALAREQAVYDQGIHVSGEVQTAEADLAKAERDVQEQEALLDQATSRAEMAGSSMKKAALTQMEARLAALDSLLDREKLVAEGDLVARATITQRKAAVSQARVAVEAAGRILRIYKAHKTGSNVGVPVVSPIAGSVTARPARVGQAVDVATELFTVQDTRMLWAEIDVYEKHLASVRVGQPVRLTSQDLPKWEHITHVSHIADVLDSKKRTARLRAMVADPSMRAGMFVSAEISINEGETGLIVPIGAIADETTGNAVYIEWPDGKGWERHAVEVVARTGKEAMIVGPAAGEQVATKGLTIVQAAVKTQMAGGEGVIQGHGHEH